jgi:hypothetical protein
MTGHFPENETEGTCSYDKQIFFVAFFFYAQVVTAQPNTSHLLWSETRRLTINDITIKIKARHLHHRLPG